MSETIVLAEEAVEEGQTLGPGWSVVYLRPDGWWVAGCFQSEPIARLAAEDYFAPRPHVVWRVVP